MPTIGNAPSGEDSSVAGTEKIPVSDSKWMEVDTLVAYALTTPTITSFANATHDHSNAAGGGTIAASVLSSGVYTPTLTNDGNITTSSLNQDFNYIRIGSHVHVSGSIQVTHDGSGLGLVRMTLPVASDFTASYDCNGNGSTVGATTDFAASIIADATNNAAQIAISQGVGTGSLTWRVMFDYIIK